MTNTSNVIETLNDLIEIHNDRIAGYEKALKELEGDSPSLRAAFLKYIDQSHRHRMALATEVQVLKGDVEKGTTLSGKIYRAWMDVKAAFTGHNEHAVLASAEFGEDAALKAYDSALEEELPASLRQIIAAQQQELRMAHNEVKTMRDYEKETAS
ncbi:ferritin-like domain-containing protein [Foetidibacter luteolus]|uniref:ferritin-like domain-containing protein n=1 Tax=Foetidibacter luteolus TaxID=2608880 RepID=UPI00129A6C44|nr:PA2169 family four-helix-bundle protein [Foetidibacter luteolus]